MTPKNIKKLQNNSRDLEVSYVKKAHYQVQSRSNPDDKHNVQVSFEGNGNLVRATCDCTWSNFNGIACSHVLATLEHLANYKNRTLSFWADKEAAKRQKHRIFRLVNAKDEEAAIWITSRGA